MFSLTFRLFPFVGGLTAIGFLLDLAVFVFVVSLIWKKVLKPFVQAAEKYVKEDMDENR